MQPWLPALTALAVIGGAPLPPVESAAAADGSGWCGGFAALPVAVDMGAGAWACANDTSSLQQVLADAVASNATLLRMAVPPGSRLSLDGAAIVVPPGLRLHLASSGPGATIDAAHASRVALVRGGGALLLDRMHIRNGRAVDGAGGCVLVEPNGYFELRHGSMNSCAAVNAAAPVGAVAFTAESHGGCIAAFEAHVQVLNSTLSHSAAVDGARCRGMPTSLGTSH